MGIRRWVFIPIVAAAFVFVSGARNASAQGTDPQAIRQELDSLRRDFETLKQQYGDRITALEARLAAAQGTVAQPAVPGGGATAANAPVPTGAEGAGGPSGALPVYGASVGASE